MNAINNGEMMDWNSTSNAPTITTMVSATTSFVFVPQDGDIGACGWVMKIFPFSIVDEDFRSLGLFTL